MLFRSVAAENPVYILGAYNAQSGISFNDPSCSASLTNCHVAAAVMGDAVTLLSNQWLDYLSFQSPNGSNGRATPLATYYRTAIIQGKNPTAPYSGYTNLTTYCGNPINCVDFGSDGGAPNFLRFLEYWNNTNVYYEGSMVSFFYAEYFTGYYKSAVCSTCSDIYGAPGHTYAFDTDFQTLSLLPPGTPMLRDVENIGFQQLFTPY